MPWSRAECGEERKGMRKPDVPLRFFRGYMSRGRISLPGSDQRPRADRSRRTMCVVTTWSILFSDRSRPVARTP